jgi:hypothetical protein
VKSLLPILLLIPACGGEATVDASETAGVDTAAEGVAQPIAKKPLTAEEMVQAAKEGEFAYEEFIELLDTCGLEFELPAGFLFKPGVQNSKLNYEGKIVAADGNLEVRFAIRPILGMEVEYRDPHSAAPEPNHIYPLLEQSVVDRVSDGKTGPKEEFGEDALAEYNADWGALHRLTPNPDFDPNHQELLLLCLHGNNRADVYVTFLFQNGKSASSALKGALHSLKFKPVTTESTSAEPHGSTPSSGHGSTPDENQ